MLDERLLAEQLIRYDTSGRDELTAAAGFLRGWLESHEIPVREFDVRGLPVLVAEAGAPVGTAPVVVFHGHFDVVPGRPDQFTPRVEGDRLYGRGAYDMKAALAAMLCVTAEAAGQSEVTVRLLCVPDEESEVLKDRSSDIAVARGLGGDFAITGEPTDLHVGIEAKGVMLLRVLVRGWAAHSSTPWLGDNAVLKAVDAFRRIDTLPFTRESSTMFERPSLNLGRISGGDVFNKVPDECEMWIDVRFLPGQDPGAILAQITSIPDIEVECTFLHPPVSVRPDDPFVVALCASAGGETLSVGREGASDAAAFIKVGIPAVEFGPLGAGHHGPEEWVSLSSLRRYRDALSGFVAAVPVALGGALRVLEGGRGG